MKKDIVIPEVKGIYLAAVLEKNEEFLSSEWNVYIINDRSSPVEMLLIVAKGYDEKVKTSTLRHSIKILPQKSFAKIELLQEEVLRLNNEFAVTYFADGKLYEKTYLFEKDSIGEEASHSLPVMPIPGVLAK